MFPKERYQYSKSPTDNPQENNYDAQMSTDCRDQSGPSERKTDTDSTTDTFDDLNDEHSMDVLDDCETDGSCHSNAHEENYDDVIFMSTYDKSQIEMIESDDDDDEPIYDDGD